MQQKEIQVSDLDLTIHHTPEEFIEETKEKRLTGKLARESHTYATKEEFKEAGKLLKDKDLLKKIWMYLSEDHIGDDNLKMTLFLVAVSSLLSNAKLRTSFSIYANTALGKDNIIRTILKHFPEETYIFLTNATQSVIEDDLKDKRIIAISEVNLFKEGGANKHLLEVIKQRTEYGVSSIKKDLRKQNKEARHELGEQGTVIFGTTDVGRDEELNTRFMSGGIMTQESKIRRVNFNTFDSFSDKDLIIKKTKTKPSLAKIGLGILYLQDKETGPHQIVIPYAELLKGKINGRDIFDHKDPRSQRDIKRLLALTCAMTWLHQKQRETTPYKNVKFIVSEVQDFINTLKVTQEFFNQTYSGVDSRIAEVLEQISKRHGWVDKKAIQDELQIKHRDTINKYLEELAELGLIERALGRDIDTNSPLETYIGNHSYCRSVHKAFNKPLIRVQINELKEYLEDKTEKDIEHFILDYLDDTELNSIKSNNGSVQSEVFNLPFKDNIGGKLGLIEHLKMNALKPPTLKTKVIKESRGVE